MCSALAGMLYTDIKEKLDKYSPLDICFVCDITGSMQTYIESLQQTLHKFIEEVMKETRLSPRLAFIGYRDKKDIGPLVVKDFTLDTNEMKAFISQIECGGGDDVCEDIVTPLKKALDLNWRSDLLFVFLLVDAPCHGKSYHESKEWDNFLDDDKDQLLEKLCCHYRKRNINLVIIKCNNTVNTMINVMQQYYNSYLNELVVLI